MSELSDLAHGALDGTLDPREHARLEALLASDPNHAREFARLALLHDSIERELVAGAIGRESAHTRARRTVRIPATIAAAAGLVAALILVWSVVVSSPANAARAELVRIGNAAIASDRCFVIRVVESVTEAEGRARPGPADARRASVLDGARLHVRGAASYVLESFDGQGERVVSGSDGHGAWIVPARGPVRVSRDPRRFRGLLPGEQHDLPFVDPRAGFAELARAYHLELCRDVVFAGSPAACIVARRRADVARGPKYVEIWYEPRSASVLRLLLDRLPQAKNGPRALELLLVDELPLAADFFEHSQHHAADRPIVSDD